MTRLSFQMHATPVLFLDSSLLEQTAIPPGDRGEQLIAYLILSSIAYEFDAAACARLYAARAHAMTLALMGQGLTYRPPRPSKFLHLVCNLRSETESLLLPVIEGILVVPPIPVIKNAPDKMLAEGSIDIVDFDIEQVGLRLRLRKLAEAIASLERMTSAQESARVIRSIITDSLRDKTASREPLDRAIDFLALGRDLVTKGNFQLAAVSLKKAEVALNVPMTEITAEYARGVETVKLQIARTIDELRRSAI
jgi:hypothetical protein